MSWQGKIARGKDRAGRQVQHVPVVSEGTDHALQRDGVRDEPPLMLRGTGKPDMG